MFLKEQWTILLLYYYCQSTGMLRSIHRFLVRLVIYVTYVPKGTMDYIIIILLLSIYWDVTQRTAVIGYRCIGTTLGYSTLEDGIDRLF
jgi:hypothetical protein